MKTEFDVVVVGAGINGLTCGAYLQKAGLDVAVVERRNECGPFCLTEEPFGAGIPIDTHAVMCATDRGPAFKDLELDKFGLEVICPQTFTGASWKDGKNHLVYPDPQKTAYGLARHSEKDAETYLRIMRRLVPDMIANAELLMYGAPSEEKLETLWDLGRYADIGRSDFMSMNGFELYDLLFESEHVKMGFSSSASIGMLGDASEKGEGALNNLFALYSPTGVVRGGIHNVVHSLVRCFKFYGGTLLLNAPVEKIVTEGGIASSVILSDEAPYPDREIRGRQAIVMHVTAPIALQLLGEDVMKAADPRLYRKMRDWDMTGHCAFTSYFLMKDFPRWKSEDWNPDIANSPFIYRAWDSWDHCQRHFQYYKNEDVWKIVGDVGETFCTAVTDRQQISPKGYVVFTFEMEYPVNLRRDGGLKMWDSKALCGRIHDTNIEIMEELRPGFKRLLLDSFYMNPLDNWRRNASALYGHELGGDITAVGDQWYLGSMPHRFPVPHLYCSQSTWPRGNTALNSGYVAATVVGQDLGVRERDWWVNRPIEDWRRRVFGA